MRLNITTDPPPIHNHPDGAVRVVGTRIPIQNIVHDYLRGERPEDIVDDFPTLALADVYATIAYYLRHREEVDEYVAWCEREEDRIREEIQRRFPTDGLKERLLARQRQMDDDCD